MFGVLVEADISSAVDNAKNQKAANTAAQRALMKWIREPGDTTGLFRDPMRG